MEEETVPIFHFLVRLKISDKIPTPKNNYHLRHFTVKDTEDSSELYRILERLYIIVFMSSLHLCTAITRYGIVKSRRTTNAYSGWYYQRGGSPVTSYLEDSKCSEANLLKLINSVYNWYRAFNHYGLNAFTTSADSGQPTSILDIFAVDHVSESSTFIIYDRLVLALKNPGDEAEFSVALAKSKIERVLQASHLVNMEDLVWDALGESGSFTLHVDLARLKEFVDGYSEDMSFEKFRSEFTTKLCIIDAVQPVNFIKNTFKKLIPNPKPKSCILNLFSKTLGHTTQIAPPSSIYNHIEESADGEVCLVSNTGVKLHCEPKGTYLADEGNAFKNLVNRVRRSCSKQCSGENTTGMDEARRAACDAENFVATLRPLSTSFPEDNRFFMPVVDSFMRTLGHYQSPNLQGNPSGRHPHPAAQPAAQPAAAATHTARIVFPDVIRDKNLKDACHESRCTQMFTLSMASLAAGNFNEDVMRSRLGAHTLAVLKKISPES